MQWTIDWFKYQERQWAQRLDKIQADDELGMGLRSYAHKQRDLWKKFSETASTAFQPSLLSPLTRVA